MLANKPLPNHADLKPYSHAVAGHEGTLCDPDGELFIKPCTQQEIEFYETAFKNHKRFAELMPVYLGTLSLNDVTDVASLNEQLPAVADHMSMEMKEEAVRMAKENAAEAKAAAVEAAEHAKHPQDNIRWRPNKTRKISTNKSVVLENAAYGFTCPNILDAKLGSRLWADDAPLEKRKRFEEISKATTNGSHGFRIAGMRVYKGSDNPADLDQEGYKVYGKDYGRIDVTPTNIVDEMRKFIFNPVAGIDEDLSKIIAGAFLEDLKRVEQILASEESRMYSASLLFTYEGDGEALRAAIDQTVPSTTASQGEKKEKAGREFSTSRVDSGIEQPVSVALAQEKKGHAPGLSNSRVDSAISLDDDGEIVLLPGDATTVAMKSSIEQVLLDGEEIEVDMDELDEDEEEEDELSNMPRIYSLKLIDFAHATWTPGQGPDENNLFGVRSLVEIFDKLSQ